MSSPRQPLGSSSNGSISASASASTSAHDAALTGATRAFYKALPPDQALKHIQKQKPPPPKSPKPDIHHVRQSPSPRGRRDEWERRQRQEQRQQQSQTGPGLGLGLLTVPKRPRINIQSSSSSITATLAAARASPSVQSKTRTVTDNASSRSSSQASIRAAESVYSHPPGNSGRRTSPDNASMRSASQASVRAAESAYPERSFSRKESPEKLDKRGIPPTTCLVQLFERKSPPAVKPPKPKRRSLLIRNPALVPITTRLAANHCDGSSSDDSFISARDHLSPDKSSRPELPPARQSTTKRSDSKFKVPLEPAIRLQPPSRPASTTQPPVKSLPPPTKSLSPPTKSLSPPTRSLSPPAPRSVSQSKPLPIPRSRSPRTLTQPEHQSITAAYNQLHPRRMTPLKSGDELANAIVASSLASSRAPSPSKVAPPPLSGRRTSHHSHTSFFSRTPSPPKKGMRHTMRKDVDSDSSSDDDPYGKHKKKRRIRKHPNKHHEGDRKRWRDAITERERKRYEGVWAANKGICVSFTSAEQDILDAHPDSPKSDHIKVLVGDQVSDLVVRDLWSRSRLPGHELEQVWDLVDNQGIGRLTKEEFVVGLWLIDQCLKGRKLPVKVTESIWNSVRLLSGIKLRQK